MFSVVFNKHSAKHSVRDRQATGHGPQTTDTTQESSGEFEVGLKYTEQKSLSFLSASRAHSPFPPLLISWSSLMPTFFMSTENRWSTASAKDKNGGFPSLSWVRHLTNSVWGHSVIRFIRSSESENEKPNLTILRWQSPRHKQPVCTPANQQSFPHFQVSLWSKSKLNSILFYFKQSKKKERTIQSKEYLKI